jgi:hypothetical protein
MKHLFRNFTSFSKQGVFYLRFNKRPDGYRVISLNTLKLKANGISPCDYVEVRVYKLNQETSKLHFGATTNF